MSEKGTLTNPITLREMTSLTYIKPGHNVYLRGGVYTGDFVCSLNGTAEAPIIIQPYPGETPIIDGSLTIEGSYTIWQGGIVVRYTGWETRIYDAEINYKYLVVTGTGVKFINNIVHDVFNINLTPAAGEFYGNLIYYVGAQAITIGRGHSLYCQNAATRKTVKRNIMHNSFGWGIHAYTESGTINNFDFIENTCFKAGGLSTTGVLDNILIGGNVIAEGIVAERNMTYGGRNGIHEYGDGMDNPTLNGNYLPDGWSVPDESYTGSGNTLGTIGNTSFLYGNDYDVNRANLTIYNEAGAGSVTVDVSSVFETGQELTVRNVQDYFEDIQTLTVSEAGTIAVDMQAANRTVAAPVGWDAPATTFPTFGCFVIEAA